MSNVLMDFTYEPLTPDHPLVPVSLLQQRSAWMPSGPNWFRLKPGYSAKVCGLFLTQTAKAITPDDEPIAVARIRWFEDVSGRSGELMPAVAAAYHGPEDYGLAVEAELDLRKTPRASSETFACVEFDYSLDIGRDLPVANSVGPVGLKEGLLEVARIQWGSLDTTGVFYAWIVASRYPEELDAFEFTVNESMIGMRSPSSMDDVQSRSSRRYL